MIHAWAGGANPHGKASKGSPPTPPAQAPYRSQGVRMMEARIAEYRFRATVKLFMWACQLAARLGRPEAFLMRYTDGRATRIAIPKGANLASIEMVAPAPLDAGEARG